MVSDDMRERLVELACEALASRSGYHSEDSRAIQPASIIVDALLESGEVRPTAHPSDSCDRHGIVTECRECGADIDLERDRYREALAEIASLRPGPDIMPGCRWHRECVDIARRALDNEPAAAVPAHSEVSR